MWIVCHFLEEDRYSGDTIFVTATVSITIDISITPPPPQMYLHLHSFSYRTMTHTCHSWRLIGLLVVFLDFSWAIFLNLSYFRVLLQTCPLDTTNWLVRYLFWSKIIVFSKGLLWHAPPFKKIQVWIFQRRIHREGRAYIHIHLPTFKIFICIDPRRGKQDFTSNFSTLIAWV